MDGLLSVVSMDGAAVGDPVTSGKHGKQKQSQWHTSLIQTKGAGTPRSRFRHQRCTAPALRYGLLSVLVKY